MNISRVVPYIGTWIETLRNFIMFRSFEVVPYIGTWIETAWNGLGMSVQQGRTLYRYVD